MATDQKTSLIDAESDQIGSVIENELPAYRAISRLAVCALIFGFLALFSFAHWFFYVFAILAIAVGTAANVRIKRYPDLFTGRGLASAGIAMGMIFGLSAATISTVETYVRNREAERFAKQLVVAFKTPNSGEASWWTLHPSLRKEKTAVQYLHEVEAAKGKEKMMHEQKLAGADEASQPARRILWGGHPLPKNRELGNR